MLGTLRCGWLLHQHPFSRSYGAFLPSSLTMLLPSALGFSPHPPVSVCGTGDIYAIEAFLGRSLGSFPTLVCSVPHVSLAFRKEVFSIPALYMQPRSNTWLLLFDPRPLSSDIYQCRNLNLLSIDYVFRPRLRPRLTQGRQALPWKPWIFGLKDSHFHLATHSGILSS